MIDFSWHCEQLRDFHPVLNAMSPVLIAMNPVLITTSQVLDTKTGTIIEERDVEVLLDNISDGILDPRVRLGKIFDYFSKDASLNVKRIVSPKTRIGYRCSVCKQILPNGDSAIGCDICLEWSHFKCQNISANPTYKYWYCKRCKISTSKRKNT